MYDINFIHKADVLKKELMQGRITSKDIERDIDRHWYLAGETEPNNIFLVGLEVFRGQGLQDGLVSSLTHGQHIPLEGVMAKGTKAVHAASKWHDIPAFGLPLEGPNQLPALLRHRESKAIIPCLLILNRGAVQVHGIKLDLFGIGIWT